MDLLCFCSVLCFLCLCARLFICALWSPAGKGLTSWLSTVSLSLSHCYPGSGVVFLIFAPLLTGVGAKSQNLSSVAPPRKKKLVTIFSQGHVWGPQKPMFY